MVMVVVETKLSARMRLARKASWLIVIAFAIAVTIDLSLSALGGDFWQNDLSLYVAFTAYAIVGALIINRRPKNVIGWIFALIGILSAVDQAASAYVQYGLFVRPGSLPAPVVAAWLNTWLWYPTIILAVIFVPLLFPTGRVVSPRWRLLLWAALVMLVVGAVGAALQPYLPRNRVLLANPLGITNVQEQAIFDGRLSTVYGSILITIFILALVSLLIRYRRAGHEERQQLKWLLFGGSLQAVLVVLREVVNVRTFEFLSPVAIAFPPVAAGIAILRYRLYDIDVIIRRTLIYTVLTIILALIYLSGVVVLQTLLLPLTGGMRSELATVLTTLTIAILFTPLRQCTQRFIDRRFYRRKYDAQQILSAFGASMRNQVEIDGILDELMRAIDVTMQPLHASLWLQNPEKM